ncbi:MAG: cobalamin-binding protein [Piscinibacter sp.]|nr:cobalamin-binding protein [Piscinibacter sp.]
MLAPRTVLRRLLAACLAGLMLAGGAARADVTVTDDTGAPLQLARPAQRIVSLAPHLTELLFAAGAGAHVVGVGAYSDYPAAARALPRVGDSALLDLERIVALKPDLLVVWQDGNSPQQLQRLATLGVPVYASRLGTLADIASTLRRLGTLAGTPTAAQARAQAFEAELAALRERYGGRRELRVFYQIWHRPLLTVNGRHLISEALRLCGARNVFAELGPLTPSVSPEAVLAADPQVIVTGSTDPAGGDNLDRWRALRATRQLPLLTVEADTLHRSSDRIVDGVRELCEKLEAVRMRGGP